MLVIIAVGIFLEFLNKIFLMTIAVVFMIISMLALMPIRLKIICILNLSQTEARIYVKLFGVNVVSEKISLQGEILHCEGTIDSNVDIPKMKFSSGGGVLKCFEIRKADVVIAANVSDPIGIATAGIAQTALGICAQVISVSKNCTVNTATYPTSDASKLLCELKVTFTTLGLILSLVRKKNGQQSN